MGFSQVDETEVKRLLRKIKKATEKCKPGETLYEFVLLVQPKHGKHRLQMVTGLVPAGFKYRSKK